MTGLVIMHQQERGLVQNKHNSITNHLMSIGISLSIAHFLLNHDAITLIISLHCKEVSLILPVHV